MALIPSTRKIDKDLFNDKSKKFIPVACHYNKDTLLTKNGELVQIIQVNGVNSEHVSDKLMNLRTMVREALKDSIKSSNFACWIHTVRRHTNLDDKLSYQEVLPSFIHNMWCDKNYWRDKFVNTLYISILHRGSGLSTNSYQAFMNSLSYKIIERFHDDFLINALKDLSKTSEDILNYLQPFGAQKLSSRLEGEEVYSELLFLYHRIIHLSENKIALNTTDLSSRLSTHYYTFGSNQIEVIEGQVKKFAAILSIKEYQEIPDRAIAACLQIPADFVATEVLYFIGKELAVKDLKNQQLLLNISKDEKLLEIKGVKQILDAKNSPTTFCNQQINVMIIAEDVEALENRITNFSRQLSKLGIVHVREDINLESTFWSQLPGNFSFLRRSFPNIIQHGAALASLHNYPTGLQHSVWGKAITILRTMRGTPYFMNFHDKNGVGHTSIFGLPKTGRTVITNFLISEASKFNPSVLYLTSENNSQIFIEGMNGTWFAKPEICHPLQSQNKEILLTFFRTIAGQPFDPLDEEIEDCIDRLVSNILEIQANDRKLSTLSKIFNFDKEAGGQKLREKIKEYIDGSDYAVILDKMQPYSFTNGKIVAVNLVDYIEETFKESYVLAPREQAEVLQKKLQILSQLRSVMILSMIDAFLSIPSNDPKILVIDNMTDLLDSSIFVDLIPAIIERLNKKNGIMLSVVELKKNAKYLPLYDTEFWNRWLDLNSTHIILPTNLKKAPVDKILRLSEAEFKQYSHIDPVTRLFLIRQDGTSIAVELNLEGYPGIKKILSAKTEDLKIFQEMKESRTSEDNVTNLWLNDLYNVLQNSS